MDPFEMRLKRVEGNLLAHELRLKTLERNSPLEARLRALERRLDSEPRVREVQRAPGEAGPNLWSGWGGIAAAFVGRLAAFWAGIAPVPSQRGGARRLQSKGCEEDAAGTLIGEVCLASVAPTSLLAPASSGDAPEPGPAAGSAVDSAMLLSVPPVAAQPPSPVELPGEAVDSSSPPPLGGKPLGQAEAGVPLSPADPESGGARPVGQTAIRALHREACASGLDTYVDPASGFDVFTEVYLRSRECCGSGCRHCPWGHRNVRARRGPARPTAPKSTLYTRKGDAGYTNLFNEQWVRKSHPVYAAIGDVDELNSALGFARAVLSAGQGGELARQLETLQGWLLDVGSALCTPRTSTQHARKLRKTRGVTEEVISEVEGWIDAADEMLRRIRNFILPGGSAASGVLHLARTICRRAERSTWPLIDEGHAEQSLGIFLNRLSDYLFVAARLDAQAACADEQEYRVEYKVDRWQRQVRTAAREVVSELSACSRQASN